MTEEKEEGEEAVADRINWNKLAAFVTTKFEINGHWSVSSGSFGLKPADWKVVSAELVQRFAEVDRWFCDPHPKPALPVATIMGTDGPDQLQETEDVDVFFGGNGADSFGFGVRKTFNQPPTEYDATILGTGIGTGMRDIVLDFQQDEDVIDLSSALQFRRRLTFDDAVFKFIGTEDFSGSESEVRYEIIGTRTIIQMDGTMNQILGNDAPDGNVDAEIELVGVYALSKDDFML